MFLMVQISKVRPYNPHLKTYGKDEGVWSEYQCCTILNKTYGVMFLSISSLLQSFLSP